MKPDTRSHYAMIVQRTIRRITGHLDEALDLDTLAGEAGVAPFHFHRIFRGMVGETALELARRLRLERAAGQLASTDRPVTAIAFDAGYEAHEAFTRAFRMHYDSSPTLFRARKYPRIELTARSGVHFHVDGTVDAFIPRDSGGQHMQVEIKAIPALRLATVRHIGPYNQIPLAFEQLGQLLGAVAANLRTAGSAMIAIYHDDPETVPLDQLRSDAAVSVPDDFALPDGLTEAPVSAGRFARTVHVGPYEQLGDTWARFMGEWLPASGHRVGSAPSYEIYLNDPRMTPKSELRTELYIPLE
jgi:AraC family transcriptional regulator